MKDLQLVNFYGDKIYLVEFEGEPYVPLKPIIENLGLVWAGQVQKILNDSSRWQAKTIKVKAQDGKLREMLCIPLRKLPAWLMSISPSKVKPKVRGKLLRYQEECDKVLWDYWFKGRAENPRKLLPSSQEPELQHTLFPAWAYNTSTGKRIWLFHLDTLAEALGLKPEAILSRLDGKEKDYVALPEFVDAMKRLACVFKPQSPLFVTDKGMRKLFGSQEISVSSETLERIFQVLEVLERRKIPFTIALKLVKARKAGLTQEEVGKALDISRQRVGYLEQKLKEISFWSLV